jgi:rhomboid protease GluP
MDLQLFLALNAMTVSALVIAVIIIYRPRDQPGWLNANLPWVGVNAAVLAVGALAFMFAPGMAGTLVAFIFLPFVAAPVLLFSQSQRQALMGRLPLAARLARIAAILHPTTANKVHADLTAALAGDDDSNAKALSALAATAPREYRPLVLAQLAITRRDWREVLAIAGARDPSDIAMKPMEIRALGETGRIEPMVQSYMVGRSALAGPQGLMSKLIVLAFGGRPDGVAALLAKKLAGMDAETKSYWTALGYLNSGTNTEPGERALVKLAAEAKRARTREASRQHLNAFAASPPQPLSALTQSSLDLIEHQTLVETSERPLPVMTLAATLGLIIANCLAFLAEIYMGGSENSDTLIGLGALWPPEVFENGEWWRLLTAAFLHFGPIHLASNMFVLWVLGRLLEPMLGSLRILAIYIIGVLVSSAFVLWLMKSGVTDYGLLVGASGAIFALLGAEAMIVLQSWWRDPEHFDRRKLSTLAVMLGLQIAIDLSVPNVSFAAHASGFFAGMLGLLLVPLRRQSIAAVNSNSEV